MKGCGIAALLTLWALIGLASVPAVAAGYNSDAQRLTVHDVGEYANWPWDKPGTPVEPGSRADRVRDLSLAVASVNLSDNISEEFLTHCRDVAAWGRQQGKKFLPRLHFWDGKDRYDGPMRDIELYWARVDTFLGAMDLRDFYGIVLAEENVHYAGRPELLTELYRRIKAKYDVDVWQWYSPLQAVPGSGGWIPADGWVIDPYMLGKLRFRQYLRKYLIAGVPVIVMPWAAVMTNPPHGGERDEAWLELARGQLQIAVEFGLPVAFFWCRGTTTYFGGDRSASDTLMDRSNQRVWAHIERVRGLPADFAGFASADLASGRPVELEPTDQGTFLYTDDFRTSRCVDDASMTGFRDLVLDGVTLRARGFNGRPTKATLTYCFDCDPRAQAPQVSLTVRIEAALKGCVEVELSPDGRDWSRCARADGPGEQPLGVESQSTAPFDRLDRFWMRIRMSGLPGSNNRPPVQICDLQVRADLAEPDG